MRVQVPALRKLTLPLLTVHTSLVLLSRATGRLEVALAVTLPVWPAVSPLAAVKLMAVMFCGTVPTVLEPPPQAVKARHSRAPMATDGEVQLGTRGERIQILLGLKVMKTNYKNESAFILNHF